jgi:hypothetical protein
VVKQHSWGAALRAGAAGSSAPLRPRRLSDGVDTVPSDRARTCGRPAESWGGTRVTDEATPWDRFREGLPPLLAALHESPPADVLAVPDGGSYESEDLLAVLRGQVRPAEAAGDRPLREDRGGAALLAAAWRHAAYGHARAVLALFDAGQSAHAHPNARACLEHAVVLQQLGAAADAGGVDGFLEQLAREQHARTAKQLDYLEALDAGSGGGHRALLAAARAQHDAAAPGGAGSGPRRTTVKSRFEGLPGGADHFYNVYGGLSEKAHAGLTSAVPYLTAALRDGSPVGPEPASDGWAETLAVLCWCCWAADDALRRFLVDGDAMSARHVPLMARVGLVPG